MKLKIFREKQNKDRPIYLKFEDGGSSIRLIVCNEEGERQNAGCLISITNKGRIYRHPLVNRSLDFDLDENGRIKEDE